jgi:hypothetical protein
VTEADDRLPFSTHPARVSNERAHVGRGARETLGIFSILESQTSEVARAAQTPTRPGNPQTELIASPPRPLDRNRPVGSRGSAPSRGVPPLCKGQAASFAALSFELKYSANAAAKAATILPTTTAMSAQKVPVSRRARSMTRSQPVDVDIVFEPSARVQCPFQFHLRERWCQPRTTRQQLQRAMGCTS